MIAKSLSHDSIETLVAYITRSDATEVMGSIEVDNLSSLKNATTEMQRLAKLAKRCKKPAWHIIIGWRVDEFKVEESVVARQRKMLSMAREVVAELHMGEHQAVYAAHWDKKGGLAPGDRHYDAHIALNRVGPDGRAVSLWLDFARVECAIATVARRHGKLLVEGRHNTREKDEKYTGRNREGDGARVLHDRTGLRSLAECLRGETELLADLRAARSGKDAAAFASRLEKSGLGLRYAKERKAPLKSGVVVFDLQNPACACAFSTLDTPGEKWGQGALELVFGRENIGQFIKPAITKNSLSSCEKNHQLDRGYNAFVIERKRIVDRNRAIGQQHRIDMKLARTNLGVRWRAYRKAARDGNRRVRRAPLQHWALELMLHFLICAYHAMKVHRAEARIVSIETTLRSELREAPTWTAWKRGTAAEIEREAANKESSIDLNPEITKANGHPDAQRPLVDKISTPIPATMVALPQNVLRQPSAKNNGETMPVAGHVSRISDQPNRPEAPQKPLNLNNPVKMGDAFVEAPHELKTLDKAVPDLPAGRPRDRAASRTMSELLKELNSGTNWQRDQFTPPARTTHQQAASLSAPNEQTKISEKSVSVPMAVSPREALEKATPESSKPASILVNGTAETADYQRLLLQSIADAKARFRPDPAPSSAIGRRLDPKPNNEIPTKSNASPNIVSNVHGPNDSKHEKFEKSKNALGKEPHNDQPQGPTASKVDVEKIPPKLLSSNVTKSFQSSPANQSLSFSLAKASAAMRQPKTAIQQRLQKYEGPSR
jgi:Relaxase/Mobilisation nuclease domain